MTSIEIKYPDNKTELTDIFFNEQQEESIHTIIKEYAHRELLEQYKLPISHKILFYGCSGCGKTMTAKAIANELKKKLIIANLGEIIGSRLGETAKNISQLFQKARVSKSILFLDEFDSIATERSNDSNDAGEMRRVVNTLIQLIDHLSTDTLLIAATNQRHLIDLALLRRFEHQQEFFLPSEFQLDSYYTALLTKYPKFCQNMNRIYGISYAEAENNVNQYVKKCIIENAEKKQIENKIL